jgi:hypothetical protein
MTFSDIKLNQKPDGTQAGKIKQSINIVREITIDELSDYVMKYTYYPSVLEGGHSNKNWVSQQVFALDFDDGLDPIDFIKRLKDIQMDLPNILYASFSDTKEKRKFRAIWVLDEAILDYDYAEFIRKGLHIIFPESDKKCIDAARMFYPGKELIYVNQEPSFYNYFISYVESAVVSSDGGRTRKLAKKRTPILYNIGVAEKSQNLEARNFNWKEAIDKIEIVNKFFNGRYHLNYSEIFGMATNLQYIEGGLKIMKKRMEQINEMGGGYDTTNTNDKTLYKYKYFSVLTIVKYGYLPQQLSNFSPFEQDWEYHNILDLTNFKRGRVDIIEERERIDLIEAETLLKTKFDWAIKQVHTDRLFNTPKIYIFRVATGIGKTRLLETIENTILAFPTNALKEEVFRRMKVDAMMTPKYPEFSIDEVNTELNNLHQCGLYSSALELIKNIAADNTKWQLLQDDTLKAEYYIEDNKSCKRFSGTILTTHTRAIHDPSFKHSTIIFDEDPLNYLIDISSASLDFTKFDSTDYQEDAKIIESYYRGLIENIFYDNQRINVSKGFREYCASIKRGDLIGLIDAEVIYKDSHDKGQIKYYKRNPMPKDKNIIIMSATVPLQVYKKMFGSSVEIIDITNINQVGIVQQYTGRSFSATSMDKYPASVYQDVIDEIGSMPVITHLKKQKIFKNNWSRFYFGNCSGGDDLKGIDIAVIGTPNRPSFVYYFYAKAIGLDLKPSDYEMKYQIVDWNGFRFRFMTFHNEDLRDIQLSLVESELIQAAGRNRTLRESSITKIFSNLPLYITQKFIY